MKKTVERHFWASLSHEDLKTALCEARAVIKAKEQNFLDLLAQAEKYKAQLLDKNREYQDWMHALRGLLPSLGYHKDVDPALRPTAVADLAYAAAMGWEDRAKEKYYGQQEELQAIKEQHACLVDALEHVLSLVPTPKNYPEGCPPEYQSVYAVEQRIEQYEQTIKELCERADEHQEEELVSSQRINELQTKLAAIHVAHQGPVPGCPECENKT